MIGTRGGLVVAGTVLLGGWGLAPRGTAEGRAGWRAGPLVVAQAAPVGAIDVANSGYPIERSVCLSVKLGANAATDCGDLRIVHPLSGVRVFNTDVTPTLLYNSQFAHPRLTVPVRITQLATTTQPDSVELKLCRGPYNTPQAGWICVTAAWKGTDWPAGVTSVRRVTISADALSDSTGVYAYYVQPANWYGLTRVPMSPYFGGGYHHVNRSASPYGAGWWLAGVDQVKKYYQSGGTTALLWVGGDGSTRTFTVGQAMYYDRLDSITFDTGQQVYVRQLPEGRRTEFDLTGRHVRTVNRFGRTTTMTYSGTGLSAGVATLALPAPTGLSFGFSYTGGRLTLVTPPAVGVPRRDTLVNTGGNVLRIRNAGDSSVQFAYHSSTPAQYVVQQRTSRRGVPQTFTFDSAYKVRTASVTPGFGGGVITTTVRAGETRGLPRSGTPAAVDTTTYTWIDGPRAAAVADTTAIYQGRYGEVRRTIDAVGAVTEVLAEIAGGWQFGWKPTRVQRPLGQVVLYEWDDRGNVLRVIDSTGTSPGVRDTTVYAYDPKFDQLTQVLPPMKDTVRYGVSSVNGRREWQQDARGLSSRVNFTYDNASYPEEVTRVQLPVVAGASATYAYAYHATTRNAISETTPRGYPTTYTQDAIGRVIEVESRIDSLLTSNRRVRQRFVYSVRGDVTHESSATYNVSPAESLLVATTYDADGLPSSVQRSMVPDPASIGVMTTLYRRDLIGRPIAAVAPDGRVDSTTFNELGKPVLVFGRRFRSNDPNSPRPVRRAYDVMGRDSIREVPRLTYAARMVGIPTRQNIYGLDSSYRALTIDTLTDTLLYNLEGRVASAKNRWARVIKTYTTNGRDSTETQRVAALGGGGFGSHSYVVSYAYDRNGRRTRTTVPTQLVPAGKTDILVSYATWGADSIITDPDGGTYLNTYTERGEPKQLAYLTAGLTQTFTYDADGRRLTEVTANNSTAFPRWSYSQLRNITQWYDGRDKLLRRVSSVAMLDSLTAQYSGLGTMVRSRYSSVGINQLWGAWNQARTVTVDTMAVDPLGNAYGGWTRDTTRIGINPPLAGPLYPRPATYVAGVGRVATIGDGLPSIRTFAYDSAGNEAFALLLGDNGGNNPSDDRASYYDAAGRLVAAEARSMNSEIDPTQGLRNSFEEYRYDALGRRVWVRARRRCLFVLSTVPEPSGESIECSRSFVRRVVWDGARELAEIQMPDAGTSVENDSVYHAGISPAGGNDPNPFYGRVVYTYGRAVDQPLAVFRLGYADWPTAGGGTYTTSWGNFIINPVWDSNGDARIGVFGGGQAVRQLSAGGGACAVGTSTQRCVKQYWPESFSPRDRLRGFTPVSYMGTLVDGKRNTTGTEYKRARVYDPRSGRFTQEDPIGLAGGLNLYGYANGDPVNFSDPFGLCPIEVDGIPCTFTKGVKGLVAGSTVGALTAGAAGTLVLPGGGTVSGAAGGFVIGGAAGAAGGATIGAAEDLAFLFAKGLSWWDKARLKIKIIIGTIATEGELKQREIEQQKAKEEQVEDERARKRESKGSGSDDR